VPATAAGQQAQQTVPLDVPLTLHIVTREATIEVIARDSLNAPIDYMKQEDFQVFEVGPNPQKTPLRILGFRMVDPASAESSAESSVGGFRVVRAGGCAISSAVHYEISIPAGKESGFHEVKVTTPRPDTTLSYRKRYYVGDYATNTEQQSIATVSAALTEAACFHSKTPSSITLSAKPLESKGAGSLRYQVLIHSDSLPSLALSDEMRSLQLDYGICTFGAEGLPLRHRITSVQRTLTQQEYDQAQLKGLPNVLEVPGSDTPAMVRFVVRDRETGNLGSVDMANPAVILAQSATSKFAKPPVGSIRGFGSVIPKPSSFCGDFYELPEGTQNLPDFWDLSPVGSVYSESLNVPNQDITETLGIPGVTRRNTWFGIDYYADFWVTKSGVYQFRLSSDDGSVLYIDDTRVINLDGVHRLASGEGWARLDAGKHTIHVPYFQGPPVSLALVLQVQPPGAEDFKAFHLEEYGPPK
jgi:hypothetical protein